MKMRWQRIIVPLFLLLASAQAGRTQPADKGKPGQGEGAAKVAAPANFAPHVAVWAADGKLMLFSQTHATLEDVAAGKRLGVWQHAGVDALSADGTRLLVIESKPGPGAMGLSIVPSAGGDAVPLKAPKEGGKFSFLAWGKGGDRLLLLDEKNACHLWDARTGAKVAALRIPKDTTVRDFAVGRVQLTVHSDTEYSYRTISSFNSSGEGPGQPFGWERPLSSPDGRFLLTSADRRWSDRAGAEYRFASLWDGRTGEFLSLILHATNNLNNWSFLPGDRLAMIVNPEVGFGEKPRGRVLLFDPASGATLAEFRTRSFARRLAWSANGEKLYVLGSSGTEKWDGITNVEVWNVAAGERTQTIRLAVDKREVFAVALSADGKHFALMTAPDEKEKKFGEVHVYDAVTEKLVWRDVFPEADGIPRDHDISWQPAGNYLMAANRFREGCRVWDARTGRLVATLKPSLAGPNVAWSPDGASFATIVSVKDAPVAMVIDLKTGKEIRRWPALNKDKKKAPK